MCHWYGLIFVAFTPCSQFLQGFGVTARSTVDTRKLDPTAIIVFHQAYVPLMIMLDAPYDIYFYSDVGEYLRDEVSPCMAPPLKVLIRSYRCTRKPCFDHSSLHFLLYFGMGGLWTHILDSLFASQRFCSAWPCVDRVSHYIILISRHIFW